jgi:hypothetical protein
MAVNSEATESGEVGADAGPANAPTAGGGAGSPRPNGDESPSGLNVSSKSYSP